MTDPRKGIWIVPGIRNYPSRYLGSVMIIMTIIVSLFNTQWVDVHLDLCIPLSQWYMFITLEQQNLPETEKSCIYLRVDYNRTYYDTNQIHGNFALDQNLLNLPTVIRKRILAKHRRPVINWIEIH